MKQGRDQKTTHGNWVFLYTTWVVVMKPRVSGTVVNVLPTMLPHPPFCGIFLLNSTYILQALPFLLLILLYRGLGSSGVARGALLCSTRPYLHGPWEVLNHIYCLHEQILNLHVVLPSQLYNFNGYFLIWIFNVEL